MADYDPAVHGDVDIIFAGGGTAACVAAGRLAMQNPDLKILLIERGKKSFDDPTIRTPALYLANIAPGSKNAIFYQAKASKDLNGREPVVPAGGVLGGGSAINFMMYTRAQRADYDSWNTPGWMADDLIPLAKKLENYCHEDPGIDRNMHGYDGPISVSSGGFRGKGEADFIKTVKEMGKEEILDMQQFGETGGFGSWQRYVCKDGKRQDAAYRYILPLVEGGNHPNIFVLCNTRVVRVLFDQESSGGGALRASGVEYTPSETAPEGSATRSVVKAKKLVVVSAGALGTPQILERSGVGNPQILEKCGIPVVSNVPGVGEEYQDHHLILYPYKTSLNPEDTIDGILSGRMDVPSEVAKKNPILGWNGIDICSKIQMTPEEAKAQGPEFYKLWTAEFAPELCKPVVLWGIVNAYLGDHSTMEPGQYMTVGCYTAYPWSRGSIHITSADDIISGYDFDTGFFNKEGDVKIQTWSYKVTREIFRRLPYCTGEVDLGHPQFPEGSKAKLSAEEYTTKADKDILYSDEDDAIIEKWVRDNVNTTWHSLGTCAMRPLEKGGVVDANLNVYGTQGLKLADLSIAPENVGANTNNTALVVGEKAAMIIAAELGIKV